MSLKAGQLLANDEFADPDCMARVMEVAMNQLMGPPPEPADPGKRGRRLFFIAISIGVIEYLKAHDADAFRVQITEANGVFNGTVDIQ
jgi:hypothetical protein